MNEKKPSPESIIIQQTSSSLSIKKVVVAFSAVVGGLAIIIIFSLIKPERHATTTNNMYEVGTDGSEFRLSTPAEKSSTLDTELSLENPNTIGVPLTSMQPVQPVTEKKPVASPPPPEVQSTPEIITTVVEPSENILSPLQQSSAVSSQVGQTITNLQQKSDIGSTDAAQLFLDRRNSPSDFILPSIPEPILSDTVVSAGTKIPITMTSGINSSTPGEITAIITQDVYATYAPNALIIPRGSWLLGTYQTSVAYGTERALIAWSRLIRPDGISVDLRGMQAVDLSGYAGVPAKVDNHWDKILGSLLVATVVNIGSAEARQYLNGPTLPESVAQAFGATVDTTQRVANRFIDRALNIPPHLIIEPGTPAYLFVRQDIYLSPYEG